MKCMDEGGEVYIAVDASVHTPLTCSTLITLFDKLFNIR
jgi:hypothetical protein